LKPIPIGKHSSKLEQLSELVRASFGWMTSLFANLVLSRILSVFACAPWLGFLVLEAEVLPGVGSEAGRDPEAL
jgi:hypothetical protein